MSIFECIIYARHCYKYFIGIVSLIPHRHYSSHSRCENVSFAFILFILPFLCSIRPHHHHHYQQHLLPTVHFLTNLEPRIRDTKFVLSSIQYPQPFVLSYRQALSTIRLSCSSSCIANDCKS